MSPNAGIASRTSTDGMADAKSCVLRLGAALLATIGCLDPANWAAFLEAGSRFSCDLVWVLILASFIASVVGHLSSRLYAATGKHLAQACLDEFPRGACILLWISSETVLVFLDAATILGTAVGVTMVLRVPVFLAVVMVAGVTWFLSDSRAYLDLRRLTMVLVAFLALVLLCFGLHLLLVKQDVLGAGLWPRLRTDSAYAAVALFGAAFAAHLGTTENQCFSDSALDLGTSVLVNVVILGVAAHTAGFVVLTLQDGYALLEPFLGRSAATMVFGATLLCSGLLSTLQKPQISPSTFGGLDAEMHRLAVRGTAVALAAFCAWQHGNEGVYQLLLLCKAVVAVQLPLVLVPLIRLTSSAGYMGPYKVPYWVEGIAWVLMVLLQSLDYFAALVVPLLSDGDDWGPSSDFEFVPGLDSSAFSGSAAVALQTALLGFVVWLTFMPLKGDLLKQREIAAFETYNHRETYIHREEVEWEMQPHEEKLVEMEPEKIEAAPGLPLLEALAGVPFQDLNEEVAEVYESGLGVVNEIIGNQPDIIADVSADEAEADAKEESEEAVVEESVVEVSVVETEIAEVEAVVSEDGSAVTIDSLMDSPEAAVESPDVIEEDNRVAEVEEPEVAEVEAEAEKVEVLELDATTTIKDVESVEKDEEWEDLQRDEIASGLETSRKLLPYVAYEGLLGTPDAAKSLRRDSSSAEPGGSGSGSLSRLSGLGRAARRQFAAVLEEFWSRLFDLHGLPVATPQVPAVTPVANDRSHQYWEGDGPYSVPTKRGRRNAHQSYPAPTLTPVESYGRNFSHLTASTSQGAYGMPVEYGSTPSFSNDFGERRYYSMRHTTPQPDYDYQPATIHGYNLASYAYHRTTSSIGSPRTRPLLNVPPSSHIGSRTATDLGFQAGYPQYSTTTTSLAYDTSSTPSDQSAAYSSYLRSLGDGFSTAQSSDPAAASDYDQWNPTGNRAADKWNPLVYRATGELDIGRDKDGGSPFGHAPIGRSGSPEYSPGLQSDVAPLSFDEISPSQSHRDGFSIQATQSESLWSRQPFELFGPQAYGSHPLPRRTAAAAPVLASPTIKRVFSLSSGVEFGFDVFEHLRVCINKLLQLDGSEWLFRLENGCDEDLVAGVAAREKSLMDADLLEPVNFRYNNGSRGSSSMQMLARSSGGGGGGGGYLVPGVPHCGDTCVWGSAILLSFGVWCVHRILELSLMESRPELWGKYTYVLNRLQGILEPAFAKSRAVSRPCLCLDGYRPVSKRTCAPTDSGSYPFPWSWGRNTSNPNYRPASSTLYLEMIKEVETAVGSRKGRTGTAAGDVAFPKGKENLASVLKRYKRRLANKPVSSSSPSTSNNLVNNSINSSIVNNHNSNNNNNKAVGAIR